MRGRLIIISGPSGVGKTTVAKEIVARAIKASKEPKLYVSVSYTTRVPRKDEVDGVDYHFINRYQFIEMIAAGAFLEHAQVYGEFYGTSRAVLQEKTDAGMDVLLVIDVQGFVQIRESGFCLPNGMVELVSVIILPPQLENLKERLLNSKRNDIPVRLQVAEWEIKHANLYQYQAVNWPGAVNSTIQWVWECLYGSR